MLLGAQLVQQNELNSTVKWAVDLTSYLDEVAVQQKKTPAGLLYWTGESEDNSLAPAVGMSYILSEYARIFPNSTKSEVYSRIAESQIDYVFGNNPKNTTFVVGINDRSPKNPQVSPIYRLSQIY